MNLSGGIGENKIPGSLSFGILHGQDEIFCELETAVAVVGEENKDQRFFFFKGRPRSGLSIEMAEYALGNVLPRRMVESLQVGGWGGMAS